MKSIPTHCIFSFIVACASTGFGQNEPDPAAIELAATPSVGHASGSSGTMSSAERDPNLLDRQRKAALSVANTLDGPTGLLRIVSADSSEPGTFRVSATGTFYSGTGFLCPRCNDVNGVERAGEDTVGYSATRLQASVTPLRFLEAFGAMRFRSVSNDKGAPRVIQLSGDTILGAKAFMPYERGRLFTFGGAVELSLLAKNRSIGPAVANVDLLTAGTLDFREARKPIPLRLHANVGYRFDNTGSVADDIERSRASQAAAAEAESADPNWRSPIARRITRIERFGFGVNRTDAIRFGLGAEWVFAYARPFVEWSLEVSANRQGYECKRASSSLGDRCLDSAREFAALPSRLTFGIRGYPWKDSWAEGVMLLAAFDIGTGATSRFVEETMPELPWAISVGLGYAAGARPRVEVKRVVEEKKVEVVQPLPPLRFVKGKVREKDAPQAVSGAAVTIRDVRASALLTDENGEFRSSELAPGKYVLAIGKDGFAPSECEVEIPARVERNQTNPSAGQRQELATELECILSRLPAVAAITGALRDSESTQFVPRAVVTVFDPKGRKVSLETDEYGAFRFEKVPAGKIRIQVSADGYLPAGMEVELRARENVSVQLTLHKRPKLANVVVTKTELKLKRQVHFLHDSAEILPDSMGIVEEIGEALRVRPDITQVEIQGHTDDSGTPEHNEALSTRRANAVRDALILVGVEPNRLVARGYGQQKPLVPNKSDANRAKNRRVQLMIIGL